MQQIFIHFPDGWLDVSPSVLGFIEVCGENGAEVTVLRRASETRYGYSGVEERCKVVSFETNAATGTAFSLLRRVRAGSIIPSLRAFGFLFDTSKYFASLPASSFEDAVHIGVDTDGAIAAGLAARKWGGRLAYLSLEVTMAEKMRRLDRLRRRLESWSFRRCDAVAIQDDDRFEALCGSLRYAHPRPFFIPNAHLGAPPAFRTSDFLRQLLRIDLDRFPRIALMTGMFDDQYYAADVAKAFANIDSGTALVLHDRQERAEIETYVRNLRRINETNLFLSLKPVAYSKLDELYSSANVGIACYRPTNDNMELIAKASGKLSEYLRQGKPVILNDLPSFRRLNEKYEIGAIVADPSSTSDFSGALDKIFCRYDEFCRNAVECYRKEYDFRAAVTPFLAAIGIATAHESQA